MEPKSLPPAPLLIGSKTGGFSVNAIPPAACSLPVVYRRRERKLRGSGAPSRGASACLFARPTQIYSKDCVQWTLRAGERYSPLRCEGSV
jgi:hypothetical protein